MSHAGRYLSHRRNHHHDQRHHVQAVRGVVMMGTMTSTASGQVTTGDLQAEYEAVCLAIRKTRDLRDVYRRLGRLKALGSCDVRLQMLKTRQLWLELKLSNVLGNLVRAS